MSNANIDFRLYLVTDRKLFGSREEMLKAVEMALQGGVRAVQLREKDLSIRDLLDLSFRMRELTTGFNAGLFINDRVDIALAAGADGVHLGVNSMPAFAAKKASGGRLLAGVSTHSINEARQAASDGADFITFGPVFETPSKMQYGEPVGLNALKEACSVLSIPVFGIGGIKIERLWEVMGQGAYGAALISAILKADDVQKTTEEFMRALS